MSKCNGCGKEISHLYIGGTLSYGDINRIGPKRVRSEYVKTLCPRCQHVMKDILLSSDLSEQWDNYDWELVGDQYVEPYND